jgi:hypothetical protein
MSKVAIRPPSNDLYETDFYTWTQQQARLLREKRWDDLDLENLIEEVRCVGVSEKREIESRLRVVLKHLLKWKYRPGMRSGSWRGSIREQRSRLERVLRDNPSLERHPARVYLAEYLGARLEAADETGIAFDLFPEECPFSIGQIMDAEFLPEEPGHTGAGDPIAR